MADSLLTSRKQKETFSSAGHLAGFLLFVSFAYACTFHSYPVFMSWVISMILLLGSGAWLSEYRARAGGQDFLIGACFGSILFVAFLTFLFPFARFWECWPMLVPLPFAFLIYRQLREVCPLDTEAEQA